MGLSLVSGFEQRLGEATQVLQDVPAPTAGQIGFLVLAVGLGMAIPYVEKQWWPQWKLRREKAKFDKNEVLRKSKRVKEAMDIRKVRLQEMLSELITDGLLTLDVKGKISGQEHRRLLKEFGEKMELPDLISTKARKDQIKEGIIKRLARDIHNRTFITTDKCGRRLVTTKIPGPKPGEPTT